VTTSHSVPAADFPIAADALMLRLKSMDNVPGAVLALLKDGNIVLEKGMVSETGRVMFPSP
jgi:Beta-lactamase